MTVGTPTVSELREDVARLERQREELAEAALRLRDDDDVAAENLVEDMLDIGRELECAQARLCEALAEGGQVTTRDEYAAWVENDHLLGEIVATRQAKEAP